MNKQGIARVTSDSKTGRRVRQARGAATPEQVAQLKQTLPAPANWNKVLADQQAEWDARIAHKKKLNRRATQEKKTP